VVATGVVVGGAVVGVVVGGDVVVVGGTVGGSVVEGAAVQFTATVLENTSSCGLFSVTQSATYVWLVPPGSVTQI
jgi:hypothetical protein